MRLPCIAVICAISSSLLVCSFADSEAYDSYRGNAGCDDCHSSFISRGALHQMHVGDSQMTSTCQLCHTSTGDNPRTWTSGVAGGQGCRGCHGVDNGTALGWGAGLRAHHANAGAPADANGMFCADCHGGDPEPSPENTFPVYYSRDDVNVNNPCVSVGAGGEDWDGDTEGLDNDGDLAYDEADSDCDAGIGDRGRQVAGTLTLLSICPNPVSNRASAVRFGLLETSDVVLSVHDIAGRLVMKEEYASASPGEHTFKFEGREATGGFLPSGVYMVRVTAAGSSVSGRIVFVK